jgi:hypothetical protein
MFLSIAFNVPRIFQYDIIYNDDRVAGSGTGDSFGCDNCTTALNGSVLPVMAASTPAMWWTSVDTNLSMTPAAAASHMAASSGMRYPSFRLSALGSHVVFEVIYSNAFYTSVVLIFPLLLLVGVNAKLIRELQVRCQVHSRIRFFFF